MRGNYKAKHGVRGGRKTYVCSSKSSTPQFVTVQELEAIYKPDLYKKKQEIKRSYSGMKREILTFIEDLKDLRKECVDCCETICRDPSLTHEGKINQIDHNINKLKEWAYEKCEQIALKLNNKIDNINQQEAAELLAKRMSSEYSNRLTDMLDLISKIADQLTDEEIKLSLEQFNNDPVAIAAFKKIIGFDRSAVLPKDDRGKRQKTLYKVISDVQHSVELLTDVKYQEDAFMGSFAVNDFYLSNAVLYMHDTAFIESLNDDCTDEMAQHDSPMDANFGLDFTHLKR